MKRTHLLFILLLILCTSCDHWASHSYIVSNESEAIIVIKTTLTQEYDFKTTDSIYILKPGESRKIVEELGALCGKRQYPRPIYKEGDVVPSPNYKFDIYINDSLSANLRLYQYWHYEAKPAHGVYELVVTNELLHTIGNE